MEDGGHLIQSRLVDVADHGHLGLRRHGGHRGAVAAADASHPDDSDLSMRVQQSVRTQQRTAVAEAYTFQWYVRHVFSSRVLHGGSTYIPGRVFTAVFLDQAVPFHIVHIVLLLSYRGITSYARAYMNILYPWCSRVLWSCVVRF